MQASLFTRAVAVIALISAGTSKSFAVPSFAESYGVDSYDSSGHYTTDTGYGSGWDWPSSMAPMPDGGYVVSGGIDLPSFYLVPGNSPGSAGHTGGYAMASLVRFAADGTILWQKMLRQDNDSYSGAQLVVATSHIQQIATDGQGNIFVLGTKGYTGSGQTVPFVAKFSPQGDLVWNNGIDHVTITEGNPTQSYDVSETFSSFCLTSDGGVVVSVYQPHEYGYSNTAIAKFDGNGGLAFYKVYERASDLSSAGPICLSNDGSHYLMVLPNDYDSAPFHDQTIYDGATLLVFDLDGNLSGQFRYQPNLNSNEIPAAVLATADGGFATLGQLNNASAVAKFSSDLSSATFREVIAVDSNVAQATGLTMQTLSQASDGGLLIGGVAQNQDNLSDPWDALLMEVSGSNGAVQSANIYGGADIEGAQGYNDGVMPTTSVIQTADGGYGLATNSYSYSVSKYAGGSGAERPDWWLAKMDANRQIRNFNGVMTNQPLSTYAVASTSVAMQPLTEFFAVSYQAQPATTTEPAFILYDLATLKLPDQPTFGVQGGVPRIISKTTAQAVATRHFSYQILTAFFPADSTLTYSASGLPSGFVMDSAKGVITGVPAAGTETTTPVQINLSVTNGVDTAKATVLLTINDGLPSLTVNGSSDPAYPGSTTPVTGLADSVLTFLAQQPGEPAGRAMTVEASTSPNDSSSWQTLTNGSGGFMPYDPQGDSFVLGTNTYPRASAVYFRVHATAPDRADSYSNVVGPFDLTSSASCLGKTNLFITHNGPVANIRWGVTEQTLVPGISVRIQSTTTPASEGSWTDVGTMAQDNNTPAPNEFYLGQDDFTPNTNVFFRAIASASGYVDSISAMNGPFVFIYDPAATVSLTIPNVSGTTGQSFDSPITPSSSSFNVSGNASSTRQVTNLSLIYDGDTIGQFNTQQGTTQFTTTTMGDHIIEAVATDDLGVIGDAPPVHVRVAPPAPARILYLTSSGNWNDATVWNDGSGNHIIPGANDLAVLGSNTVTLTSNVTVGALSMNGATINYSGNTRLSITINHFFTVGGGRIHSDIDVTDGATMLMINDSDLQLGGLITNNGYLKIHGKGGISGIPGSSGSIVSTYAPDGFFDFVGQIWNKVSSAVVSIFRPAGGRNGSSPQPAPSPSAPPEPELRQVAVASITNAGKVVSNDGGSIVSAGGGNIVSAGGGNIVAAGGGNVTSQGSGSIVSAGGGNAVAQQASGLVDKNGNPLLSEGGNNLIAKAELISQDGSGIITHDGASLISQDGSGAIPVATGAANMMPAAAALNVQPQSSGGSATAYRNSASDTPPFVQTGGQLNLNGLAILGAVELDGGVLNGNGTIGGDLTNNGAVLTPGNSTGLLNVTGNFTQAAGGTLTIEAYGGDKNHFDQVHVGGNAALGGQLNVFTFNNYVPLPNDPFAPLSFNGASGNFKSVNTNVQITGTGAITSLAPNSAPPPALQLSTIKSRQTHGSAGTFDVDLGLNGSGVEPRRGGATGDYSVVFTFTNPISNATTALTSGAASLTASGTNPNAQEYVVHLTGVSDVQALTVSLTNLQDVYGQTTSNVSGILKVLIGDVNGDGAVNSADATTTRNDSGQTTNATNFRADINLDGAINSADATTVRNNSGHGLSPSAAPVRRPPALVGAATNDTD